MVFRPNQCSILLCVQASPRELWENMPQDHLTESQRIAQLEAQNQALQRQLQESQQARNIIQKELHTVHQSCEQLQCQARAIAAAQDGIGILTPSGEFIDLNQAYAQLFGYRSPTELLGKNWRQLYSQPEFDYLEHEVLPFVFNDGTWRGELTAHHQSGHHFIQEISLNLTDKREIICIFRDITARKQIDTQYQEHRQTLEQKIKEQTQVLQTTQNRLQHLADNLPGVLYRLRLDANSTYSMPYASEACREIYELDPADILLSIELVHPHDRRSFEQAILISARSLSRLEHEHRIITPSGKLKWVQVIARPERQDDEAIMWDGIVIEISDRKAIEKQLQENEAKYHQILDSLTEMVLVKREESRIVWANRAFREYYGMSNQELDNLINASFNKPNYTQQYIQDDAYVFNTGKTLEVEEPVTRFDGEIRQFNTIKSAIRNESGEVILTVGISRDITERKDAEQRLKQREAQYRQVFETLTDGLGIIDLDTGNLVEANPAYHEIHGYSYEEFMAVPLANHIHNNSLSLLEKFINEVQSGRPFMYKAQNLHHDGQPIDVEVKGFPFPYQDKTHALTHVRNISQRVKLEFERQKQAIAIQQSADRISQQVRREQLLNQLTTQIRNSLNLEQILETTVRVIQSFLDIDRCHFAWYHHDNQTAYWEVVTECQKNEFVSLLGQHDASQLSAISELVLRQKVIRLDDVAFVQDQTVRETLEFLGHKSMLIFPVCAQSGRFGVVSCIQSQSVRYWQDDEVDFLEAVVAQLVIALNQSELLSQSQSRASELEELLKQLQQTQAQLVQSEKMSSLGQMVAGVAHEINNPVSFIHGNITHATTYISDLMGLIQLYRKHYPQPHIEITEEIEAIDFDFLVEDIQKLFRSMQMGTDRIREIIQSLRTFSRLDEAEIKEVNLHEGIESTIIILKTRLRAQDWRPEIEIIKDHGELPLIECYAGQLNQVFMNILSNAIDALEDRDRDRKTDQMREKPSSIRIKTRVVMNNVVIRITDNGPGISEANQARLFDPFFTTKAIGKGTGLGLSISYQIITERHDGTLTCSSKPGSTTFTIKLPIRRTTS